MAVSNADLQKGKEVLLDLMFNATNKMYSSFGGIVRDICNDMLKKYPVKEKVPENYTILGKFSIKSNTSYADFDDMLSVIGSMIYNTDNLEGLKKMPKPKNEFESVIRDFNIKVLTNISSLPLDTSCEKVFKALFKELIKAMEDTKAAWKDEPALFKYLQTFKAISKFNRKMEFNEHLQLVIEMFTFRELFHELCRNLKLNCGVDYI